MVRNIILYSWENQSNARIISCALEGCDTHASFMNRAKFGLFASPLLRCVGVEGTMRAFRRVKEEINEKVQEAQAQREATDLV